MAHCDGLKVIALSMELQNSVVSSQNRIVVPELFTTARRTGFYINHIHLEQRT